MPFHMFIVRTIESLRERSADSGKAYRRISGKGPASRDSAVSAGSDWQNSRVWNSASLTVECAIALPFFFLCLIMLISFMDAVGLYTEKSLELSNRVRQMAMYAGTLGSDGDEAWIDIPWTVTYRFPVKCVPVPDMKIAIRARVHPWTGYSGSDEKASAANNSGEYVYLTENQEVYHTHADCTHLNLCIMRTNMSAVGRMRNQYGSRYKPCPGFPAGYSGDVYITAKGEYYYPRTDYGSLTRHVRIARRDDHTDLCLCSRCAARDAA